uniref:NADH-ubiquinone oxidoreductase chain 2 n=1 Tax=Pseudobiotus spinifer TaxID=1477120 RepID=A0A0K0KA10_9BILA|nr:NADH dehydogenase subunit 2 [Pseudobiotus spinifer]
MNKNLPILFLSYFSSIILTFTLESWFSLWVTLELNTLTFSSILLLSFHSKSSENSTSYFVAQAISSLVLLMSIFSILFLSNPQKISFILNLSLFFKLTLAPFQAWAIPISMHLSWSTLLLLVTAQKVSPLIFLEMARPEGSLFVISLCALTCLLGSLSNLSANSLKFLLIFSTLSSTGWIVLALMSSSTIWKFFLVIYFFNLLTLYAQLSKKTKTISNSLMLLVWLSVAGLPPFMGFFPKITIIFFLAKIFFYSLLMGLLLISALDIFIFVSKTYNSFLTPPVKAWLAPSNSKLMWLGTWVLMNCLGFVFFFKILS